VNLARKLACEAGCCSRQSLNACSASFDLTPKSYRKKCEYEGPSAMANIRLIPALLRDAPLPITTPTRSVKAPMLTLLSPISIAMATSTLRRSRIFRLSRRRG